MNDLSTSSSIIEEYLEFIGNKAFPCIGAKAALGKERIRCLVVDHLACPKDDNAILEFIYDFVDDYRQSSDLYSSAVVIFKGPLAMDEERFEAMFWLRLQSISNLDSQRFAYDQRVGRDPASPTFSFSLKEEAFYIIGLHPGSSRLARQFTYPAIVFNPHTQFEKLREISKYEPMKQVVRSRDVKYSGSVNPMLADFGETSEVVQYSGRKYDENWRCPFISQHGNKEHHTAT
ncbi:MAG TPA: guanitoxin biosynthesis heme-dependent pre-guanitoxin N-hydroxylase GntA [Chryseolinea sp.]|nr:guanitoxin biosynthesis heme-dependent pre-guanitoxin N-hydroxylase GntA [Chryseolinea sp.]